jgi:hypothetical protein
MVVSLRYESAIAQQWDFGFIPEIARNAAKYHAGVRLE